MRLCRRSMAECSIRLALPCTVEGQLQEYMGQVNPLSWLIAPSPTGDLYNVSYAPAYSSYRKVCPAAFSSRSHSVYACGDLAQCAPCHGMQLLAHCASSLHSQLPVPTWLSETLWTTSSPGAVCRVDVWTWPFLSNCQHSCWSPTQSAVCRRQSGIGHGTRMPTSGRQPSRPASARSSSCGTCHRASSPMAGATLGALASAADMHVPLSDPPRASGSFLGKLHCQHCKLDMARVSCDMTLTISTLTPPSRQRALHLGSNGNVKSCLVPYRAECSVELHGVLQGPPAPVHEHAERHCGGKQRVCRAAVWVADGNSGLH